MRVALALLALVAVAYAADFTDLTEGRLDGFKVNAVAGATTGSTGAAVWGGISVVESDVAATEAAPVATFYAWLADACTETTAAAALAKNQLASAASNGATTGAVYNLYLKANTATANANLLLCTFANDQASAVVKSASYWPVIEATKPLASVITAVAKVGGGADFIYGDKVTFTTAVADKSIYSLGNPTSLSAADQAAFGVVIANAAGATSIESAAYLGGVSNAALAPWVSTGGIETLGLAQSVTIDYKFQTSVATLNKVNDMTYPKMNYTSGDMVTFTVMKNNTAQGTGFFVVALKGAGTAADCDKAVTDKKAIYAEDGVKSKPWMVPNVTAGAKMESYSVWVKAANVTVGGNMLACTAQAGWNVVAIPKAVVPTPTPAPAPAPGPVAPAPAAASTTGTSSASAVRGGLLAAFACVLAGLGVSAAF